MIYVESFKSFGDNVFNTPLLKRIADKTGQPITIATHKSCEDAFYNLDFISEIININRLYDGVKLFGNKTLQITPQAYFPFEDKRSLLDTQYYLAELLQLELPDRRPIINFTQSEDTNHNFKIAIESEYFSGQSWAEESDFRMIINTFKAQKILWCSKTQPPDGTHALSTRRETIANLRNIDIFFCVGSGIFCASRNIHPPKKTYVLWKDELYKYVEFFKRHGWNDVVFLQSREELFALLNLYRVKGFFHYSQSSI